MTCLHRLYRYTVDVLCSTDPFRSIIYYYTKFQKLNVFSVIELFLITKLNEFEKGNNDIIYFTNLASFYKCLTFIKLHN